MPQMLIDVQMNGLRRNKVAMKSTAGIKSFMLKQLLRYSSLIFFRVQSYLSLNLATKRKKIMLATNKKKMSVILFLAAFTVFGMAAYNPPKAPRQNEFKNLQVLPKDISKEALDKVMHNFNDALGVKCMFCHIHTGDDWRQGWEFDKDDKDEKGIARLMLKMTAGINSTYFNFDNSTRTDTIHVVSCITCHRGIAHPDAKGIADQMQSGGMKQMAPPPPPPAPNKN
jgi:hypothetical protein